MRVSFTQEQITMVEQFEDWVIETNNEEIRQDLLYIYPDGVQGGWPEVAMRHQKHFVWALALALNTDWNK